MPKTGLKKDLEEAIEKGDSGKITTLLKKMFLNAVELNIKTTVTDQPGPKTISTKINIIDGDIETFLHKEFVPDAEKVTAFHKEQVNKGEEIIARNLNTLKTLGQSLMELF